MRLFTGTRKEIMAKCHVSRSLTPYVRCGFPKKGDVFLRPEGKRRDVWHVEVAEQDHSKHYYEIIRGFVK